MQKIRIGIIGVGIIGNSHLEQYSKMDDVELVAACDINRERLDSICERYGIPNRYENIGKLLERDDLDAVDVCLHNNLHAPVSIEVMKKGKNCYCEKPMAGSYKDAKSMYEAAREYGKKLHIQLGFLYSDETKAAKILIEAGELGKIYHMRSTGFRRRGRPYVDGYATKEFVNSYTSGGGALFDMGVYHISQLLYLTGTPKIERIVGRVYQETDMDKTRKEISGYNVEELGTGYVHFENNLTMDILESWAIHIDPFDGSFIVGSEAGLRLSPLSFHKNFHDLQMDSKFDLGAMNYRNSTIFADKNLYQSSQKHWIAVLQGKCQLLPTNKIALDTQLIQEGIYLSTKYSREVTAEEVDKLSESKVLDIPNLKP